MPRRATITLSQWATNPLIFGNQRHAAGTAEVEPALYFVFVPREQSPKASCHFHAMALALVLSCDAEYIICCQLSAKGGVLLEEIHDREWCLYFLPSKRLTKELSLLQVRAFVKIMAPEGLEGYWIWRDGFKDWIPLSDCAVAMRPLAKAQVSVLPPSPPGYRENSADNAETGEHVITLEGNEGDEEGFALETVVAQVDTLEDKEDKAGAFQHQLNEREQNVEIAGENVFEFHEGTEIGAPIEVDNQETIERREVARYKRRYKVIFNIDGNEHLTYTVSVSMKSIQVEGKLPYWIPRNSFELILERYGKQVYLVCHPYGETRDQVLMIESISEPGTYQKWLLEW